MKKTLINGLLLLIATAIAMSFSSCSDEDESSGTTPIPVQTDINGNKFRVSSVGRAYYQYDENGHLKSLVIGDTKINVNGSTFSYKEKDEDDGEVSETVKVNFNQDGLITSWSTSGICKYDDGEWEKWTEKGTLKYNSERQMTSMSSNCTYSGKIDEESYSERYSIIQNNIWEDGNLVKWEFEENDDGDKDEGNYDISYGNRSNPTLQFPLNMIDCFEFFDTEIIAYLVPLGYCGVGPTYFPTSIYYYSLYFSLNDNGTIHSENGYTYSYDSGESSSMAPYLGGATSKEVNAKKKLNIRKRHKIRHRNQQEL
ncbi:MAG: hypothetical protein IJ762_05625 [Bacteroidaceae bacterium]|nr:hypothetical protein [Bacteroidaceae bacterium]